MVENHPILLQQQPQAENHYLHFGGIPDDSEIPELNYTAIPVQESQISSVMDLVVENLLVILIISISIIMILWALIRRRNLNLLIMDDSEFSSDQEHQKSLMILSSTKLMKNFPSQPPLLMTII